MTVFAHLDKSNFKNIESWSSPYSPMDLDHELHRLQEDREGAIHKSDPQREHIGIINIDTDVVDAHD